MTSNRKVFKTWTLKGKIIVAQDYHAGKNTIKELVVKHGISISQIYKCVEDLKENTTKLKNEKKEELEYFRKLNALITELRTLINQKNKFQRRYLK